MKGKDAAAAALFSAILAALIVLVCMAYFPLVDLLAKISFSIAKELSGMFGLP